MAAVAYGASVQVLTSRHKVPPSTHIATVRGVPGEQTPVTRSETRATAHEENSFSNLSRKLSAKSAFVMDGSGRTLYALSPDTPRQPASTIKVLTGLIAMNNLKNSDMVYISKHAARMPASKVYLKQGSSYRANDLISSVLLASANDASVALAEKISGSEKSFAQRMTATAIGLGAKNTFCKNANGLTARGQQSTSRDLAIMFRHAMDNKEFAGQMQKSKMTTSFGKLLRNHNKALWRISGAVGGKTGYTSAARQTYVGKFTRGGKELYVAIMGSETMWDDISHLVDYGFQQLGGDAPVFSRRQDTATVSLAAEFTRNLSLEPLQILSEGKKISKM